MKILVLLFIPMISFSQRGAYAAGLNAANNKTETYNVTVKDNDPTSSSYGSETKYKVNVTTPRNQYQNNNSNNQNNSLPPLAEIGLRIGENAAPLSQKQLQRIAERRQKKANKKYEKELKKANKSKQSKAMKKMMKTMKKIKRKNEK
jgi:hypothetical protein